MRKHHGFARWLGALLCGGSLGCAGTSDNGDAGSGPGGTAGTACADYTSITDPVVACRALEGDCPENVEAFLTSVAETDAFGAFEVFEGDGFHEVKTHDSYAGAVSYVFADDGRLIGFRRAIGETAWGPCETYVYSFGELPSDGGRFAGSAHHCDLASDALQTGKLCDCPCPDPAPADGIYEGSAACVALGTSPTCEPTFDAELYAIGIRTARMRSGCGFRTLMLESLGCSYDENGALIGQERTRAEVPSDECPGVDAYRAGDVPAGCDEETVCYLGTSLPEGGTPCP